MSRSRSASGSRRIGITGPIGCGKSTIAGWLGERPGAVVIDADVTAREVLAPGSAAPLESTTCPRTVARNSCAATPPAISSSPNAAAIRPVPDCLLFIVPPRGTL